MLIGAPFGHLSPRYRPTYTFNGATVSNSGLTTYTFAGASLGTASSDRLCVVSVKGEVAGGGTIVSSSIGGVSATVVEGASQANGSAFIIQAAVPTGATGDIVIEWSGVQVGTIISCYSLYRLFSQTVHSNASTTTVSSDALTISSLSPPANSIIIAASSFQNKVTNTWSGTAGVVEDHDEGGTVNYESSSASLYTPTALTTPTIITTGSGSPGTAMLNVAIWR